MKRTLLLFTSFIFLISTFYTQTGNRQFINYEYDNGWNLGLNAGGTWQRKEAFLIQNTSTYSQPFAGFSGGFTFGKAVYEKEGRFFAFDLRFRYLRGVNYGWLGKLDTIPNEFLRNQINDVPAYRNYKMDLNEFSLEGVLTLNSLRERTGIILYGFGGVGIVDYRVKSNFYQGTRSIYEYPQIPSNYSDAEAARFIRDFSDDTYESDAVGVNGDQLQFMPSLGFGLGYQINPWVSIGFEHKVTFALQNNLDGLTTDLKNDNYHYTTVKLGFNLFGSGQSSGSSSQYQYNDNNVIDNNHHDYSTSQTVIGGNTQTTENNSQIEGNTQTTVNTSQTVSTNSNNQQDNNVIVIPSGNPPLVNIINPAHSNTIVHNSAFHLISKVYYVSDVQNIQLLHNGFVIQDFLFDVNTNELRANLSLSPGENIVEITGTNNYGSDHDEKEIVYEVPQTTEIPPFVVINHPHNSPYNSNNQSFVVTAKVLNIDNAQQIEFLVNGISHSNFSYNTITDVFTSSILLEEGSNKIIINAVNNAGSASDSKIIKYIKEVPPTVQITSPSASPTNVGTPLINITGKVLNVPSKNQIMVRHNGYNVSNFMYNTTTKEIAFGVNLIHGQNIVEISAYNSVGTASDFTKINFQTPELTSPPVVTYVQPSVNPYQTQASNVTVIAKVLNVSNKNQTSVGFNGSNLNNYSFNSVTKLLTVNLNLSAGTNQLKISGTNQAGTDTEELNIVYSIPQQIQFPKITIIDPSTNPFSTSNNTHIINGLIEHVEIASNASATINNQPASNFTFDPNTDKFVCDVTLKEGANIFEVDAVNSAGTASKSTTLIYVPVECYKPTILLTAPNNWQTSTTNSKGYLEMQINGEQSIVFKVNGEAVPSYNFSNGKFSSFLHLVEGVNNYEVIATNECGSTYQNVSIVYEQEIPCNEPAINFIRPLGTGVGIPSTTASNFHLSFNVLEIATKAEISLKLNGTNIPFNFDKYSGEVQANVVLVKGINTFAVRAKNHCGDISKSAKIKLEDPILPPKIKLTQPSSFPFQTQNDQTTVAGKISNVTNKNHIHVYLDGQPIGFSFNPVTGFITIPTSLQMGGNQLIVEAENEAGSDQANAELIRIGNPPSVHLTNRSENTTAKNPEYTQINSRISIIGYVSNFDGIDFSVDLNGSPINFIYNSSNGTFRGTVNINDGDLLKFTIKASNEWGEDTQLLYLSKQAANNNSNSGQNGNGNNTGHGNNGHGNNSDGVDVSNPGKGIGGPNSKTDQSGSIDDENKGSMSSSGNNKTVNDTQNSIQQQKNNEYQKLISKANMYYNSKRWSTAKSYYNKALQIKPRDSFSMSRISSIDNKLRLLEQNRAKSNTNQKTNTNSRSSNNSTNTKSTQPNKATDNSIKSGTGSKAIKKDGGKN